MAKESPLQKLHAANGAEFRVCEGWELPLHFGDALGEYHAVRDAVGLLDLSQHALIRFTGPDRASFLHGTLSNDIKGLKPGQGCHAATLDAQGKILADLRVFCESEELLLDIHEPLKEKVLTHLNRYLIADDVEITDLTAETALLSLQGPRAPALLKQLLSAEELPERELEHRLYASGDLSLRVIASDHTGSPGFDLAVPTKSLHEAARGIEKAGKKFGCRWIGTEAWELLRVEAAIPRYGTDMSEENLLLETGLERAVSFHKGCYLGQEVVERIRSRGHVNKMLLGMILSGDKPASAGDLIRSGEQKIGEVTSSVFSPALGRPVALGYLNRNFLAPGTKVLIEHAGSAIEAEVASLPFVHRA